MENLDNPQEEKAGWKAPGTGSQAEPIDSAETPEAQTETVVQPEEPDTKTEKVENARLIEIQRIQRANQELANEMRLAAGRIKSEISNVSPRDISFQHLNRFQDEYLSPMRKQIQRLSESIDNLHRIAIQFNNNNPGAERALEENLEELKNGWRHMQKYIEDAADSMNRIRRRTEDYLNGSLESEHPIRRIGYQLRHASDEYHTWAPRLALRQS